MSSRAMAPIICTIFSREVAIRMSQYPQQVAPFRDDDRLNRFGFFVCWRGFDCPFTSFTGIDVGRIGEDDRRPPRLLLLEPIFFFNKPLPLVSFSGSDEGDASADDLLNEKRGMVMMLWDFLVVMFCEM